MNFRDKLVIFLATGFYAGNMPVAPGTFGTAVGLVFCWVLSLAGIFPYLAATCAVILFSVWIAHETEKLLDQKDPGRIVIDEIAGILVTFAGVEFTVLSAIFGFFIFRGFDIVKPFPIRAVEKRVPGGAGVVLDDVIAGIMSNVVLRILLWVVG